MAKAGSGKITHFVVKTDYAYRDGVRGRRLGPSAVAFDARGRVVNAINGREDNSEEDVRRSAKHHWPDARELKMNSNVR